MYGLHVATRKGLFELRQVNGGFEIKDVWFLGDPVTMIETDPSSACVYAALNLGHFGVKFRRKCGREDWQEFAPPSLAGAPVPEGEEAPSLFQIWALERGAEAGELWAGCIPAALFHSRDGGESWTLNRALWQQPSRSQWFGGGYDQAGIHSILLHPDDDRDMMVGVSCGGVWHSSDKGQTWSARCSGLRAAYMPPEKAQEPAVQDPHLIVQAPSQPDILYMQHHNGIFVSRDRGQHWRELMDINPSSFGFAVAVHPNDPQTAWFVPAVKDECRVPPDGRMVVNRTVDGGDHFEVLDRGLPGPNAYDLVYRHALAVSPDGQRLACGSTTGGLWVSSDAGDQWRQVDVRLPPIYALKFTQT